MSGRRTTTYGALVHLYPRAFRDEYGADLVQSFDDLVADRGRRAAWSRSAVDLLVTVPRYRLEAVMPDIHSTATIRASIVALAVAGVAGFLAGFLIALVLVLVAIALAAAQRTELARAIRQPERTTRRRRLWIAAGAAVVTLGAVVSYATDLRDDEISGGSLLAHNAIGVPAMVVALVFLLMGLATPRAGSPAWLPAGVTAMAVAVAIPLVDGGELNEVWWTVMAVSGLLGLGLLALGVLDAFTTRSARASTL